MNRVFKQVLLSWLSVGLIAVLSACEVAPSATREPTVVEIVKPASTVAATLVPPTPESPTPAPSATATVVATETAAPAATATPQPSAIATEVPSAPSATPSAQVQSQSQPKPASDAPLAKGVPDGYRLVFGDEFDGPQLDAGKWTTCYHWVQRVNNVPLCATKTELQIFQPDNVTLDNGLLRLRVDKLQTKVQFNDREHEYSSGMITSFDKFKFKYGYAEIRARMPKGRGFLSAFWTMPIDKTWPPEIDVIEVLGQDPTTAHLTLHFPKNGEKWKDDKVGEKFRGIDLTADFNTFAVLWEPNKTTWYVNGEPRFSTDKTSSEEMYLLATLALGGNWAGPPDGDTPFPAYMDVDYIRVYQK